jgi:adenylosuccinate synthase
MLADIVVGLSYGDEGKGKVTHHLLKNGDYTHCIRFNGGCNAGHTIYHEGVKFVTHHIPAGVFFGVKSIIGNGCVVNIDQFQRELQMLHDGGIKTEGLIYIANNAHIITDAHLEEDGKDVAIGTTKQGNGPAYRDKYNRKGTLASEALAGTPYLIDLYTELYDSDEEFDCSSIILCEGAQGFGLDIDWGDYPYVTSSHCTTAGALLNGIPPQAVRRVYGVAKAYDTYVGAKEFHGEGRVFNLLQQLGQEFGATTGRPRQCNWLNIRNLKKAVDINGVTDVIINKVDILRTARTWNLRSSDNDAIMLKLGTETSWKQYIKRYLNTKATVRVVFSESPERI